MTKTEQKAALLRQKAVLEAKMKTVETKRAAEKKARIAEARRNSLSYLIESEMDKAAVVMAAQGIVDKLGKMAEDLAKVEGDEIMPMMDSLKTAFGPQMADAFQKLAGEHVRAATVALTSSKDAISTEVSKLEGVVEGGSSNDMAAMDDVPAVDPVAPAPVAPEAPVAPANDMATDDAGLGDDATDMGDLDDLFADDKTAGNAAGRAKKESARPRGRALNESVMSALKDCFSPHMSNTNPEDAPRDRLNALKPYVVAEDFELAAALPDYVLLAVFDKIDDDAAMMTPAITDPMAAPVSTTVTVPSVPSVPAVSAPVGGMDDMGEMDAMGDELGGEFGSEMDDMGSMDTMEPEVDEMDMLSGHPMFENLDRKVLSTFRKVVREGYGAVPAAQAIARRFGIEFSDVVEIVKEAKAKKADEACETECEKKSKDDKLPAFLKKGSKNGDKVEESEAPCEVRQFRDWAKLYREAKSDKVIGTENIVTYITDNTSDTKLANNTYTVGAYRKAVKKFVLTQSEGARGK